MKGKDRILAAFKGQIPDRVPVFDMLNSLEIYKRTIGRTPRFYNAKDAVECAKALGLDAVWVPVGGFNAVEPPYEKEGDIFVDEWGTTYKVDDATWPAPSPIDYPIKTSDDLENYTFPNPNDNDRVINVKEAVKYSQGELAIIGGIRGPFSTASLLMGYENLCISIYTDLDLFLKVMDEAVKFYKVAAKNMIDAGVDVIKIHDDYGFNTNTLISPEHWKLHVMPRLADLVDFIKKYDVPVMLHSCGNINSLLPNIIECGVDGIHPLQRTAQMNLAEVKALYGDKVCIIGNVDATNVLPTGDCQKIKEDVRSRLIEGASGGRYIICSDHSFHSSVPLESAQCFIKEAKEMGEYDSNGNLIKLINNK